MEKSATHPTNQVLEEFADPIEAVSQYAESRSWSFMRTKRALQLSIAGQSADYHVMYSWDPEEQLLYFGCGFEQQASRRRAYRLSRLIVRINECIRFGHFEHHPKEGIVLLRNATALPGGSTGDAQVHALLEHGLKECERYYPAFQYIALGRPVEEAFERGTLLGEPMGKA